MQSNTLAIRQIFGQERRLIVPLFQRPYVWNQEEQWEPLWADIVAVADRTLTEETVKPHFLGALVLDAVSTPTGQIETRLVIDGQQRLTTIQLLLQAFCDVCAGAKVEDYQKALQMLTRNEDPLSTDPDEKFKVWPTNVDQDKFRQVMSTGPVETLNKANGNQLSNGYAYFYNMVLQWLKTAEPGLSERVKALYETVRNRLRVVVIDLDEQDDAQVIFETLNARGTPLLPADLIKNFLFHRALAEKQQLEPLYQAYWQPFDEQEHYWRAEFGRGHTKRARVDWFFQNYLTARIRDDVSTAHLYNAFREHALKAGSAVQQLTSIRHYASVYQSFDHMPQGSREARFFARLRAMDIVSPMPFVLELFANHAATPDEVRAVLVDLESFLVRRMVCSLNTRGYNSLFVNLLGTLDGEGTFPQRVRKFLLAGDKASTRWPNDFEFKTAWLDRPIFQMLTQQRIRLLLEAIEQDLHNSKTENLQFTETLTIEHLLPQDWTEHWPLPPESGSPEDAERRNIILHTIGNLTLLTESLNPSVSNGPWEPKLAAILEHSALTLNRKLLAYKVWNEDTIRDRAQTLFSSVQRIWPHPNSQNDGSGDSARHLIQAGGTDVILT